MTAALDIQIRLPLDRFDLDFDLRLEQPSTGIFGASGSGKTSLLETVAGLRRGAEGILRLGDAVWLDSARNIFVPPERRKIGWVPQDGLLFPHLDVRRNLLAGRHSHGVSTARVEEITELLGILHLLDRTVDRLSGGERQRVALGRALCSEPELLLLDEPLASLDVPRRRRLLGLLRRVRAELTVPMLFISHDPLEVQALCDDLVVIREGRCIAQGEPRTVLADPGVYGMALGSSYENVLPGLVEVAHGDSARIRLGQGVELLTGPVEARGEVLVGLRANDLLLAVDEPRGLSARNVLPARVRELRADEGLVTVDLAQGMPPVFVQVTQGTPERLSLRTDMAVYLVVKATACRVYTE